MIVLLSVIALLVLSGWLFMRRAPFGALPSGERQQRIERSAHFRDGSFQNIHVTPTIVEGKSTLQVMKEFFFHKSERLKPARPLPSRKTDLRRIPPGKNSLVWFGHSSYYLQTDGRRILVDPVLSGNASPVSFTTKSYAGTDVYHADDFPEIDYLVITHDHWDHLDYPTLRSLGPKIGTVITGLGTGAHFERWGIGKRVIELEWNEHAEPEAGFRFTALPARHFSGRGFRRNRSMWVSFALEAPSRNIYIGGDSGYDTHFAEIGTAFGPFDLAILECGQYNTNWKYIHMLPEETVQAAFDLRAKSLLPVHWGKFSLAQHAWDEPIIRVTAEAQRRQLPVLHPMIGEPIDLDSPHPFGRWWETVEH